MDEDFEIINSEELKPRPRIRLEEELRPRVKVYSKSKRNVRLSEEYMEYVYRRNEKDPYYWNMGRVMGELKEFNWEESSLVKVHNIYKCIYLLLKYHPGKVILGGVNIGWSEGMEKEYIEYIKMEELDKPSEYSFRDFLINEKGYTINRLEEIGFDEIYLEIFSI